MPSTANTNRARVFAEFAVYLISGLLIFGAIATAALALRWMIDFLRSENYPLLITKGLGLAENAILGIDVVLLVIFTVRSLISLIKAIRS